MNIQKHEIHQMIGSISWLGRETARRVLPMQYAAGSQRTLFLSHPTPATPGPRPAHALNALLITPAAHATCNPVRWMPAAPPRTCVQISMGRLSSGVPVMSTARAALLTTW